MVSDSPDVAGSTSTPGTPGTPGTLLARARAGDPSGPFLTFYDDASGERVELSLTTLDNWVAKTANLLQDDLGVGPGDRLGVFLPTHWQGAVWMLAAWSVGMVVDLDDPTGCSVVVAGPESLPAALDAGGTETVALALRPLGGPFTGELPEGVLDYGAEVLAHGDRFAPYVPVEANAPALVADGSRRTGGALVEAAAERAGATGIVAGTRLLTDANPAAATGYLDALLAPLAAGGSVVLLAHPDPARRDHHVVEENVDLTRIV